MEDSKTSKYAILKQSTKLRLHQSPETLIESNGNDNDGDNENIDEVDLNAGTLIRIHYIKSPTSSSGQSSSNSASRNFSTVQILDLINHKLTYENLYECPQENIKHVNENLWPFVISIKSPEERANLLMNTKHCEWLEQLRINDFVSVSGKQFSMHGKNFNCVILYIGPVTELNSVGYFFLLKIVDSESEISPQTNEIPFCASYVQCEPSSVIITTGNWIKPVSKEEQKKFPAIINDTIEKVKSAITSSSILTGTAMNNKVSLKSGNKSKKSKGSTQFYDKPEDTTDGCERIRKEVDMPPVSEEYKKSIENRERGLERRANAHTVQCQTQPPSDTLKNKYKEKTKRFSQEPQIVSVENDVKSVLYEDREKTDIDLKDILGPDWPKPAGETGAILNWPKSNKATISQQLSFGGSGGSASGPNISNQHNRSSISTKETNNSASTNYINNDNKKTQNGPSECLPTVLDDDFNTLQEVPGTDLGLGSMVEVNVAELNENLHGVIRWIGIPPGMKTLQVGVELEEEVIDKQLLVTDGGFNGISLFKCPAGRGIFVDYICCSIDRRFLGADGGTPGNGKSKTNDSPIKVVNGLEDDELTFGHMDCPIVPGVVAPIKCFSLKELDELCGKFKGIQGHHNSCYLDVTLFSMFAFTPVFDTILYRPREKDDIPHYTEVQNVLRDEIVNPLRKNMFVRADRVMKLRQLLDKLSSVSGLTSEEKDPEEFLNCLLSQIMRAEPFLKLNSGQDAYYYQLFVEKDERLSFPNVQQLFEQSFCASDIKLKEVPSCLIIQMPRFGKNYKMYQRILPSQVLDVTDVIDDSPRQCAVCGQLAEFECRDCFGVVQSGLESISFCPKCLETVHKHAKRFNHTHRKLLVPQDFRVLAGSITIPRLYMELFAVVCIETSHYVTFVKAGSGPDAPWCFFDSMADRKGERNGYNIPEMLTVPELPVWLSDDGARTVNETSSNDKMLPEHAKRLFCDAYMCMYQSTDVVMYR